MPKYILKKCVGTKEREEDLEFKTHLIFIIFTKQLNQDLNSNVFIINNNDFSKRIHSLPGLVPVLVFPPDLVFRADQRSGPRQLLTLYNPTGAALRFRVLCTAPAKYTVFDTEGYVKPQSCTDIVIRHVAPIPSHYDVQDRFRIELSEEGAEGRVVGRKDVTSVLRAPAYPLELQGQPDPTPHPGPPSWTPPPTARHFPENRHPQLATSSFLLFLLTGIVSVAFLLLPLQDELGSQLPQILHVSLGQKLVAAYILGLLTMVFLRT
ncbi:Motile sperm domain-containing protein 3 [Vulpes lagopus]